MNLIALYFTTAIFHFTYFLFLKKSVLCVCLFIFVLFCVFTFYHISLTSSLRVLSPGLIIDFPIIPSSVAQFVPALLTKVRGYESSCQKLGGKFIYSKYVHLEYLCTFLSSVASCVRRISRSFCTIKWVWSSQAYFIHNSLFLVDSFNCPRAEKWRLTSFKRLPRNFSSIIWIP